MTLAELLASDQTIIADGATGTQLAKHGLTFSVPELCNLEHPDVVARVPRDYADAGAQIVLTNTLGGTPVKLAKAGIEDCVPVNTRAVELSKSAVAGRALVFVSVGPTGELIGLTSTLSEDDIEATFAAQAEAVVAADPDGFVVETMSDLNEAKIALRAIKSVTDLPVAVSLTFEEGVRAPATMMGITPQQAATELTDAGADLVGANCGRLEDDTWVEVIETFASGTDLPVWAKPNAGIPQLIDGEPVFSMEPAPFAQLGTRLAAAGAKVVGGCCGTGPAHIAALVAALR